MNGQYKISEKLNVLIQALTSDKNKVAFLLGAGCPMSIRINDQKPLIPGVAGLTKIVLKELDKEKVDKLKNRICTDRTSENKERQEVTIEDILSHARLLIAVIGDSELDGLKKQDLIDIENKICQKITTEVSKELPPAPNAYHKLVSWISGIPREHPVEVFTTNYDLLLESALEAKNTPYFDGFVGSRNAFFDLHTMEHEALPSRWVRLWKMHGSINWWVGSDDNVFRGESKNGDNKQMIYPSHLKYSQSRRMPYLAMQDRLSNFLSAGQSVLITNGYSFVDQHLNEIITQRLSANPRSVCFGLLYGDIDKYKVALDCACKTTNLHLLAKDATFSTGAKNTWEKNCDKSYDYLTEQANDKTLCKIGDFDLFGEFLIRQTGNYPTGRQDER